MIVNLRESWWFRCGRWVDNRIVHLKCICCMLCEVIHHFLWLETRVESFIGSSWEWNKKDSYHAKNCSITESHPNLPWIKSKLTQHGYNEGWNMDGVKTNNVCVWRWVFMLKNILMKLTRKVWVYLLISNTIGFWASHSLLNLMLNVLYIYKANVGQDVARSCVQSA